jgi:DHA2 family multidrug resistance protein
MSQLNADAFSQLFIVALIFRGIGLALTNIPLINTSVSTLTPAELPMGIALTNMFRQLGGAMGIAVLNTYINNHAAQHRNDMLSNIATGQPVTDERVATLTNSLIGRGVNPFDAVKVAYTNMELAVNKQALMLAYLDSFQLTALFFVLSLPFLLLIENKKPNKEAMKAASEAH